MGGFAHVLFRVAICADLAGLGVTEWHQTNGFEPFAGLEGVSNGTHPCCLPRT